MPGVSETNKKGRCSMVDIYLKVPKTADGFPIYPGMPVFICSPYSTKKSYKATIYNVGYGEASVNNDYFCVLVENRYFDGEYWNDGNTEHVSKIFADETECLRFAHDKNNRK